MANYGNRARSGTAYSSMAAQSGGGTRPARKSRKSKRSKKSKRMRRTQPAQPRAVQVEAYVTEESFKTDPGKTSSFHVRVSPRAQKGIIVGWMDDEHLKVRLVAAPEGGRANIELLRLLGHELKIPVRNLSIVRGSSSTSKLVKVVGLDDEEVRRRLPK
ncbi:MAG: DUF167 domain-containing protein [bacterium]